MATNLTSGVASPGAGSTSHNTASISPTSGAVVMLGVMIRYGVAPASNPTVSGAGLTWTLRRTQSGAATRRLYAFTGVGTPSAGAVTISRGGSDTFFQIEWKIDEETGRDTTNPVVQAVGTDYTSDVSAMSANFATMASGSYGWSVAFLSGGSSTPTARPSPAWTLVSGGIVGDPNIQTQTRAGTDTATSIAWSFAGPGAIIGLELAQAGGGGGGGSAKRLIGGNLINRSILFGRLAA